MNAAETTPILNVNLSVVNVKLRKYYTVSTQELKPMLKQIRHAIVNQLWEAYRCHTSQITVIEQGLKQKNIYKPSLDHFAVIDLPGPHTGIPYLTKLFSIIGYESRGDGYLPDKQNDFHWMAEEDSENTSAKNVLPQVVVADFRLEELPPEIKIIIEKYARLASPPPLANIATLAAKNDALSASQLVHIFTRYLTGRDWPLPTVNEFQTVHDFNELLAWVLVFGRRPNHFTFSIHLLPPFKNLIEFHQFVECELQLTLNKDGGVIKGNESAGIAQGSTAGIREKIALDDGTVELPTSFVEFVWRFPVCEQPSLWNDYFTGFIAQHADRVIESLYTK